MALRKRDFLKLAAGVGASPLLGFQVARAADKPEAVGLDYAYYNPVSLVLKADEGRLPDLLALRHGRMVLSPFTFYRGSALAMAVDLAGIPSTGVRVQCANCNRQTSVTAGTIFQTAACP